jgi:hypothetical protein
MPGPPTCSRRKFSYDLWGDTANAASRMETTGVPGCIQVTERTRNLLGERYRFQERGRIQVKGKGKMHLLPEQATHRRAVANTGLVRAPQHARQLITGAHGNRRGSRTGEKRWPHGWTFLVPCFRTRVRWR